MEPEGLNRSGRIASAKRHSKAKGGNAGFFGLGHEDVPAGLVLGMTTGRSACVFGRHNIVWWFRAILFTIDTGRE